MKNDPDSTSEKFVTARYSRRQLVSGLAGLSALSAAPTGNGASAEMPLSAAELWNWVRAQQLLNPKLVYLDTATLGPNPRSLMVAQYRAEEAFNSDPGAYLNSRLAASVVRAWIERIANWLECGVDELCFTAGANEGLNLVANGLDLASGDEVVTTTHEQSGGIAPWLLQAQRRGIVVKQVALPSPMTGPEQALGLLAGAVTDRTRVMAFSHVQSTDGAVLPVQELCTFARQRNILSVVDGSLAFAAFKFSLRELGCDFYAASLDKWLNGPYGSGVLYVREEQIERLWPLIPRADEALAYAESAGVDWPRAMSKFSAGFGRFAPWLQALEVAFNLHEQIGRERIEARIRELAIYAKLRLQPLRGIEILTPAHPAMWSAIMSFKIASLSPAELAAKLAHEDNILAQAVMRPNFSALRISLHIYNSHDDIERLLQGLQRRVRNA